MITRLRFTSVFGFVILFAINATAKIVVRSCSRNTVQFEINDLRYTLDRSTPSLPMVTIVDSKGSIRKASRDQAAIFANTYKDCLTQADAIKRTRELDEVQKASAPPAAGTAILIRSCSVNTVQFETRGLRYTLARGSANPPMLTIVDAQGNLRKASPKNAAIYAGLYKNCQTQADAVRRTKELEEAMKSASGQRRFDSRIVVPGDRSR